MSNSRWRESTLPTAVFQGNKNPGLGPTDPSDRPDGESPMSVLPVGSIVTVTRPLYQKTTRNATGFSAAVQVKEETFKAKVTAVRPDDGAWEARAEHECEEIAGRRRASFVYPPISNGGGQAASRVQVDVVRRSDAIPDLTFDVPVDQIVRGRRKEASWRRDRTLDGDGHHQVLLSIGSWSLTYDRRTETTPHRATWKEGAYVAEREDGESRPYRVVADREGNTSSQLSRKRVVVPGFCQEDEFLQALRREMNAVEEALGKRIEAAKRKINNVDL